MIMKKLLYTDTTTVSISILRVACFPVIVKNLRMITEYPNVSVMSVVCIQKNSSVSLRHYYFTNYCERKYIQTTKSKTNHLQLLRDSKQ